MIDTSYKPIMSPLWLRWSQLTSGDQESHDLLSSGDRINFNLQGVRGLFPLWFLGTWCGKFRQELHQEPAAFPWGRRFVGWNGNFHVDIHSLCSLCRVWVYSVEIPIYQTALKHCLNEMLMIDAGSGCWCLDWQGNLQKTRGVTVYNYHMLQQFFGIRSPCYPHNISGMWKTCHSFSNTEDFRYRPGITYRGIASYKRCLYLSVTEMDVVPCTDTKCLRWCHVVNPKNNSKPCEFGTIWDLWLLGLPPLCPSHIMCHRHWLPRSVDAVAPPGGSDIF